MKKPPSALIVDDEPDIRELLAFSLQQAGFKTAVAPDLATAERLLLDPTTSFDLCLSDLCLADGNGIELIQLKNKHRLPLHLIMISAHGSIEIAIQCLKGGAFDFLTKPIQLRELETLLNHLKQLLTPKPKEDPVMDEWLAGTSVPMRQLKATIRKLSATEAPILIEGPSGSGKERVARLLHTLSIRREGPFIAVNCGAIPRELLESELFGHKKGSFTGAISDKKGLFQAAEGGTLFLDEIAELPLEMQVKLLRVIQEKSIRPVGATQEIPVDIRILSATHRSLSTWVKEERFRSDLYYRINVIELLIPALQDHLEDIPDLVEYWLKKQNYPQFEKERIRCSESALAALKQYHFPGNIRELENMLERACALAHRATLMPNDFPLREDSRPASASEPAPLPFRVGHESLEDYLNRIEKQILQTVLNQAQWNRTRAAEWLGLTLKSMRYRIEKLGLSDASNPLHPTPPFTQQVPP